MKQMSQFLNQKKMIFAIYILWTLIFVSSVTIHYFVALSYWSIIITFFGLIFPSGYALARIFKLKFEKDVLGQLVLWFSLGLVFSLIVAFVAMLLGLVITTLSYIYFWLVVMLLILAFIFDLLVKQDKINYQINLKSLLKAENLGYILVFISILVVCLAVAIQGTLLKGGDPDFHMSILTKVFGGKPLSPTNLGFIKSDTLHIAYGLPVWHVFVGEMAVFSHGTALEVWKFISLPLTMVAFLIWAWLFQLIFKNRFFVWVGLAFLAIYIYNWNTGYLFTCLPIPDTFNNMLLFPLVVGLTLKYIFDPLISKKFLWLISSVAIFMALIHGTQYLYYLMMLFMFILVWAAIEWKNPDYKKVLIRTFWVILATFLVFVPFVILLELKTHALSKTISENMVTIVDQKLRFGAFDSYNTYGKYAYIFLPLTLLFMRKNKALIFIFASMILVPIIYWGPIVTYLTKMMGYIFVNRLFGSVVWHFIILGFISAVLIMIIDHLVGLIKVRKAWQYFFNLIFIGLTVFFAKTQFVLTGIPDKKDPTKIVMTPVATVYNWFFSDQSDKWLGLHFVWFLLPVILITAVILIILWKKPKFGDFFTFSEPKNGVLVTCLIAVVLIIFFSPTYQFVQNDYKKAVATKMESAKTDLDIFKKGTTKAIGGQEMVDFVKNNVPAKSVFMTPGSTVYTFPIILDQFIVAYPRTGALNRFWRIYDDKYTLEEKLIQIGKSKVEYIMLYAPAKQGRDFFDKYPEYFVKVFDKGNNTTMIYQVLPAAFRDYKTLSN